MHGIFEEELIGSRKPSLDGSSVTYDLSENVDYLTPKELGIALSEVFFENDGIHWFSTHGKNIKFTPGYRVRFLFPEKNAAESRTAMCYFYYNLEKEIIPKRYAEQLKGSFDPIFGLAGRTRESLYSAEFKNNVMDCIDVEYV